MDASEKINIGKKFIDIETELIELNKKLNKIIRQVHTEAEKHIKND